MTKKIVVVVVKDEKPDCKLVEQKLMALVESLPQDELKQTNISLHIAECNLVDFVHKEKEFTKNILHQRFMVKFNHKLIEDKTNEKKVLLEKEDRAGNKDQFEVDYDEILIIDTSLQ